MLESVEAQSGYEERMSEEIRVEDFGDVRPHQSYAFNFHLAYHLEGFDREYAKMGGRIQSLQHQADRMDFARFVSVGMLEEFANDPGIITQLNTQTTFICESIEAKITVKTTNDFSYGTPPEPVPSLN